MNQETVDRLQELWAKRAKIDKEIEVLIGVRKKRKKPAPKPKVPFTWKAYLERMEGDSRVAVQLIAYYFKVKNIRFDSEEESQVAIRRHIRDANEAAKFDRKKVIHAIDRCKKEMPEIDWTIGTIVKLLIK